MEKVSTDNSEKDIDVVDLLDALDRLKGLNSCLSLLIRDGEHRNYKPDPTEDLTMTIDDKINDVTKMLNLYGEQDACKIL